MEGSCEHCLGWSVDRLSEAVYVNSCAMPNPFDDSPPGESLFQGPGRLPSALLLAAWDHCIDMYAIRHVWLDNDVTLYFKQLCINEDTTTSFIRSCRRNVYLQDIKDNPHNYTHEEIAETIVDANKNPEKYLLPLPPAMWSLGDTEAKTEGIMHLSMGIQKAVFKFIIRWATGNRKGAELQKRMAENLAAVQFLKLAYCPCRPYKDDKFGGFTAETQRAMCMISVFIYRSLLETNLDPAPHRGPNPKPQKEWTKQDNHNWLYVRNIEAPDDLNAVEMRLRVEREMEKDVQPEIVCSLPEPITTAEIRDLVWRMFNMFRAIFCLDLAAGEAKNRALASVMRFLSLMEVLDLKLNPKREKPIWIAKFNFLGLLRVCESFVQFNQVRNLYEGGVIGEGMVKELRPLVAKGVQRKWATNLLLAHYRNCTLNSIIDALEDDSGKQTGCLLGNDVEPSKFKRYTTAAEVLFQLTKGRPVPVVLYGCPNNWKIGVIIVTQKQWNFKEVVFHEDGDFVDDPYGLTYHRVHLAEEEICLGVVDGESTKTLGGQALPFWDYGLIFPDLIEDIVNFRYGVMRSGWQYLDKEQKWSEHE
jgi:hypothetical protein